MRAGADDERRKHAESSTLLPVKVSFLLDELGHGQLVRKLEETDAAKKYETRLRELYDIAIKAFRGQYEAPTGFRMKPRPNACEKTYTKCTHVDFTFEDMMNTVKAKLLITKWGEKAMHKDKQRTPPPEAYETAPGLLKLYTIKS